MVGAAPYEQWLSEDIETMLLCIRVPWYAGLAG